MIYNSRIEQRAEYHASRFRWRKHFDQNPRAALDFLRKKSAFYHVRCAFELHDDASKWEAARLMTRDIRGAFWVSQKFHRILDSHYLDRIPVNFFSLSQLDSDLGRYCFDDGLLLRSNVPELQYYGWLRSRRRLKKMLNEKYSRNSSNLNDY